MLNKRDLAVLGVAEGSVMASAILRTQVPSLGVDLSKPLHLAWLVATCVVSAMGLTVFVVRSTMNKGTDDDRKQALGLALAIIGLAGLFSIAGPGLFEQLVG